MQHFFGDPSRELAAVLLEALDARPGAMVGLTEAPGEGPRLQDVLAAVPGVEKRFVHYLEVLGYNRPTKLMMARIARRPAGVMCTMFARLSAACCRVTSPSCSSWSRSLTRRFWL